MSAYMTATSLRRSDGFPREFASLASAIIKAVPFFPQQMIHDGIGTLLSDHLAGVLRSFLRQAGAAYSRENGGLKARSDLGGRETLGDMGNASLEPASLKRHCGGKFGASAR
jgi:hypothetical protein